MRCHFCDGSGLRRQGAELLPCPECGGCGVAHCCDGIQACCEIEGDARLEAHAAVQQAPEKSSPKARMRS